MTKKNYIIFAVIIIVFTISAYLLGSLNSKSNGLFSNSNIDESRQIGKGEFQGNQRFDRAGQGALNQKWGMQGKFVNGEVLSNDGTILTIKLQDGGSRIVFTSPSTKFDKSVDAVMSDISLGKSVYISGEPNPDGSMTAQTVQIR